jgi:hypothetical protein
MAWRELISRKITSESGDESAATHTALNQTRQAREI